MLCTVYQFAQCHRSQVSSIRRQCCVSRDSMWRIMANCPARALRCGTGEQTCMRCLVMFRINWGYTTIRKCTFWVKKKKVPTPALSLCEEIQKSLNHWNEPGHFLPHFALLKASTGHAALSHLHNFNGSFYFNFYISNIIKHRLHVCGRGAQWTLGTREWHIVSSRAVCSSWAGAKQAAKQAAKTGH